MKNFYCSYSSEAWILGNRLIYQNHPGEKPEVKVESSEGAKKEGFGLWDIAKRGQKETQKELDHLDFLKVKARLINTRKIDEGRRDEFDIIRELNDKYRLGIEFGNISYERADTDGTNIIITIANETSEDRREDTWTEFIIKSDGTFVRRVTGPVKGGESMTSGAHISSFDSKTGGTLYTLPKGGKAPDEF